MCPTRATGFILVAAALIQAVPAQTPTVTSPSQAAAGPGNSNNWYPFGNALIQYQQVHSADSFSTAGPLTVTSLSFRPRQGATAAAVDMELFMADAPHDAFAARSVFADNVVTGTEVQVMNRRRLNLPATTTFGWNLTLPFDRSFSWAGGHMAWRLVNHDNYNGGTPTYYACDAFSNYGQSSRTGSFAGCASATGTQPAEQFLGLRSPGTTSTFYGNSYVASGGLPAILIIGLNPLAIDMTAWGAPGCVSSTSMAASLTGVTRSGPDGPVTFTLPMPRVRRMQGATFYSQIAFVEPAANRLGIFLTNGSTNVIGRNYGATRITGGIGGSNGGVEPMFGLSIGLN